MASAAVGLFIGEVTGGGGVSDFALDQKGLPHVSEIVVCETDSLLNSSLNPNTLCNMSCKNFSEYLLVEYLAWASAKPPCHLLDRDSTA